MYNCLRHRCFCFFLTALMADILILGANGYSGRQTAKYLLEHPQRGTFKLALAARSRSKLEAAGFTSDPSTEIWALDVSDEAALEAAIAKVKVVVNCVGPYWRTGTPIVRACVRQGKHYVDITGEVPWIYDIIQLFDFHATRTRSIVVPACGFDSVPSDALVHVANRALKARHPDAQIEDSVTALEGRGGVGAGTFQTLLSMIEEVPRSVAEIATQAYALSPVHGGKPHPPFRLVYSLPAPCASITGGYYVMSSVNRAIVQRTFGLLEADRARAPARAYGPRFRYDEFMRMPGALLSCVLSVALALGISSLVFLSPARWLFRRLVPATGNGPSEVKRGRLHMTNVTTASNPQGGAPIRVKSVLQSDVSPLYTTSVMLAEAALSLLNPSELPALARKGGVLTPMSAFGDDLISRMESSGHFKFTAEIVSDRSGESAKTK